MNLSQFLWLLSERSLYFATLAEFEDKWEGVPPSQSLDAIGQSQAARAKTHGWPANAAAYGKWARGSIRKQLIEVGEAYRVMCWHESNVESVAMWKLYTRGIDGVAIQTTVARLESCLASLPFVGVGRVDYSGYDPGPVAEGSAGLLVSLLKRRSFAHEQELRFFVQDFDRPDRAEYWDEKPSPNEERPLGGAIKIEIGHLIERIVVSPDYPAWAVPGLQTVVTTAGLNLRVQTSDLLKLPDE
jgi:hypothetical protein